MSRPFRGPHVEAPQPASQHPREPSPLRFCSGRLHLLFLLSFFTFSPFKTAEAALAVRLLFMDCPHILMRSLQQRGPMLLQDTILNTDWGGGGAINLFYERRLQPSPPIAPLTLFISNPSLRVRLTKIVMKLLLFCYLFFLFFLFWKQV